MAAPNLGLRVRWLAAMRQSTDRATGRECDFARSDDAADAFDPIGLLADLAEQEDGLFTHFRAYPMADGLWVSRQQAEVLARAVGFPPSKLYNLCLMNDTGASWDKMADFVSAWYFYTND